MHIFRRIGWLLMFIPFFLVALLLGVQAWRAFTSKSWPTTDGTVIAFYGTPDYQYLVNSRTYTNSYVSCNEFFNGNLWAQNSAKYAVRYPLQAKVSVHYHPSRPRLATLETTFDPTILVVIGVLALISGLCFAGFLFGWRFRSSSYWERDYSNEDGEVSLVR